MITQSQVKNVITFYFLDLMKTKHSSIQPPTHVTRDSIFFNKMRADACGNAFNVQKYSKALGVVHRTVNVQQINSTPANSTCWVDNVAIPLARSGMQLICKTVDDTVVHIVIQKKYQNVFNSYFKMRHYPDLLQQRIRTWLTEQSWYLPNCYKANTILKKLLASTFVAQVASDLDRLARDLEP